MPSEEEEEVSSGTVAGNSGSKRPLVITLAVIGVVVLIIGVLWFLGDAPGFLNAGSHVKGSGHHLYRGIAAVVVGIAAIAGAYVMNKKSS
jgi:uncharacterized membrane protein HdeD (DUF308 family)